MVRPVLLLVEDDELIGFCIVAMLESYGYQVDWQKTGLAADVAISHNQYALILLDSDLPGKSGLELLEHVRRRDAKIPVIIATAHDSIDDEQRYLQAGATCYLTKPLDTEAFVEDIRHFLEEN